ncbi:hypothetical protein ACOMHN_020192 [Nucella lapillus]
MCCMSCSTADWLEKECGRDWECGESHTECYSGLCVCSPGYYYSQSRDSCENSCPEEQLRARTLAYPGCFIRGNNIRKCLDGLTVDDCLQLCSQSPGARTCDYVSWHPGFVCCLQGVTMLGAGAGSWESGAGSNSTHFQKTCS